MKKLLTASGIKLIMNLLIIYTILSGGSIIVGELYQLCFNADEIDLIRLEIPWTRPMSDVTIMLHQDILENNQEIHKQVSKNIIIHDLIERTILLTLIIFILIQLKRLIVAINMKTLFEPKNLLIIRNLGFLVVLWVIGNFLIYHLIPFFIPLELMYERINFVALNESIISGLTLSLDLKMLLVAILLYVIYISFKEVYQLKEQTDLTI